MHIKAAAHHVNKLHGAAIQGQPVDQETTAGTGTWIEYQIPSCAHDYKPFHVTPCCKLTNSQTTIMRNTRIKMI